MNNHITETDMTDEQTAQAKFSQSRNDMHWSHFDMDDGFIRWGGYNDANWWDNVSKTEHARTRTGKVSGRVYTLDFDTSEVTIAEQVQV